MKTLFKICLLLLPVFAKGQQIVPLDTALNNQWTTLSKNWRYQKGDHKEWANPSFDDSSWKEFSNTNLNMPDGEHAIANLGEIVWFRKRIKADSSLNKAIVLNIFQLGASEIYLDGKLIHQLGKVSSDINQVVYNNPQDLLLELPLEKGKEQILAVRYVNARYKFPIYTNINGFIRIHATTLSNANSIGDIKNNRIAFNRQFINNISISLGISILMFIIFLSFFLFFPNEKINGYFATSILFLILFNLGISWTQDYSGNPFWFSFFADTCVVISFSILLYCLYNILEQPLDILCRVIVFLGIITIGCYFLYEPDFLGPIWAILTLFASLRIAVKSWNKNRVGSILFMLSSALSLLFWMIYILNIIGLNPLSVTSFIPFAFMVMPVTLSIYLGYSFGKRSQELRLNLEQVKKLSKEKESILSLQNETLETQVQERTASLNRSIEDLKSTQAQLIQSEKMASLGELTAGIAHEIQNPLNFVNNFSEVSTEMIQEIKEERTKSKEDRDEALQDEILEDISKNLEKISLHGNRASSIVKGMLEHSRTSSGEKELIDINALADEYLKLAYHGLRAKDKSFNAEMKTDFDENLPTVAIIPQDIGRVFLNLINNAFYAVNEKQQAEGSKPNAENYKPTVTISTKNVNGKVEIIISDNGNGIPQNIIDKIFQPFFTTKPTGKGTGLGLSLAYDIVKAHGGEIKIGNSTVEQVGTTFIITLPLSNQTS
ncbi:MAG: ATP-binding protein [Daejeonella sp.]